MFFADPLHSALLHLLYIQFLGYPAAYPPVHSVPQKFAGISGISMTWTRTNLLFRKTSATRILTNSTMFVTLTDSLL